MAQDLYEGFAERYDLFYGEFGDHDPAVPDFFNRLFDEWSVHSVLDCACGTGRDLHLFSTLGCEVVGSDISESMLAQARRNLAAHGLEIPLHRVDYRALPDHFGRRFDAVVCLSSSILHMPTEAEVLQALTSMRRVLHSNGILVLTQGTSDKQWREKPRFILAVNTGDFSRLFVIDYLEQGAVYNILDIFHGQENYDMQIWRVTYPLIPLKDDYARLLRAAGFQDLKFYGSYDCSLYDKAQSERLIIVAAQ